MFCKNCNSPVETSDVFCPNCGHKWDEEPVGAVEYIVCPSCNSPIGDNDIFCPSCGFKYDSKSVKAAEKKPVFSAKKKTSLPCGRKKLLVILLILAGLSAIFWKPIFFAVAPEKYMSLLVKNTFDELSGESSKISKNVLGFKLAPDKTFTAGVNFELYDANDDVEFNVQLANFPKKKKMLVKGEFDSDDYSTPFEAFLNDKEAGASFAGTDDEFLIVPSKEFGKGFEDSEYVSDLVDRDVEKILSGLNFSYSNIMGFADKDSKFSKRFKKHISTNLQEFFKSTTIGKRENTKYNFGSKTVNAKKITVEYETDKFYDFLTNLAKDVKNDTKMHQYIGEDALGELMDGIDELKDSSSNHQVKVEIIEYNGKIVSISFSGEVDDSEYWDEFSNKYTTTISTGDKKNLLASITFSQENEYRYGHSKKHMGKDNYSRNITFVSNWVEEDEEITASITRFEEESVHNKAYDYNWGNENEDDIEIKFDFKKGKWNCDIDSTYEHSYRGDKDRNSSKKSYEGDCSKKDGFTFTVGNEWTDGKWVYYRYEEDEYEKVDASFDLEITFRPKADLKISEGEHINIFEWDDGDFEDFAEEVEDEMRK